MTLTVEFRGAAGLIEPYHVVAIGGNNGDPGSLAQLWATIAYGVAHVTAGEHLYIRGGTYYEAIINWNSGTSNSRITVQAYPGEVVIVDGNLTYPGVGAGLLQIYANYLTVKNLYVANVAHVDDTAGIWINDGNESCVVDNCYVHDCWGSGIIAQGNNTTIQNCRVYNCCLMNYHNQHGNGWPGALGLMGSYPSIYPQNAIIKGNTVWNNWGEGILLGSAYGTLCEDNILYDNFACGIYFTQTRNAIAQRNLLYSTGIMDGWGGAQNGIEMGEEGNALPQQNNTIINNLFYGNRKNLYYWLGAFGGGLVNDVIANNTFVNSRYSCNIEIANASHSNTIFKNNIVRQDDSLPVIIPNTDAGITYDHNCWSKAADANAQGPNDVTDNPDLAEMDIWTNPLWYKLQSISPARGEGLAIGGVEYDFWGTARSDPPDMGAHEY